MPHRTCSNRQITEQVPLHKELPEDQKKPRSHATRRLQAGQNTGMPRSGESKLAQERYLRNRWYRRRCIKMKNQTNSVHYSSECSCVTLTSTRSPELGLFLERWRSVAMSVRRPGSVAFSGAWRRVVVRSIGGTEIIALWR